MEPGRIGAGEVGGPAGEDVERAAAVAGQAVSIAWISASFSAGPSGARGRPPRDRIVQGADGPRPARESCGRLGRGQHGKCQPAPRKARRRESAVVPCVTMSTPSLPQRATRRIRPARPRRRHRGAAARPHRHDAAKGQHESAEPDPPDQRIDVEPVDRLFGAVHRARRTRCTGLPAGRSGCRPRLTARTWAA